MPAEALRPLVAAVIDIGWPPAGRSLVERGGKEALDPCRPLLEALATSEDPGLAEAAEAAPARCGSPASLRQEAAPARSTAPPEVPGGIPGALHRLDDPDPAVRRAAVAALGWLEARDQAPAIARGLEDPSAEVRFFSEAGLDLRVDTRYRPLRTVNPGVRTSPRDLVETLFHVGVIDGRTVRLVDVDAALRELAARLEE